jgi:heterodisulfide reductase subunit C
VQAPRARQFGPTRTCGRGHHERAPFYLRLARHEPGERLVILNDREGVWRCRTIFNCTEACPREIRITKAIGEVKKAILKGSRDIPIRQPATSHGG